MNVIQIDLVENDEPNLHVQLNILCEIMGGIITNKSFVNWKTGAFIFSKQLFFLAKQDFFPIFQCIISSLHYITELPDKTV